MNYNSSTIVSKIWAFCHTLRDDGVDYGDYLEQLTYLLFLKIADEHSKPPHNRKMPIPKQYNWETVVGKSGDEPGVSGEIIIGVSKAANIKHD